MYGGIKDTKIRKEKYMNSYFSIHKERLIKKLNSMCENDDIYSNYGHKKCLNLLLHGPPGSGKSSLAYRIAMSYNRNIISVDLSSFKSS